MDLFLFSVGSIGFIAALIFLIISLIKKKSKKKPLIALGIFFAMFAIGLFMAPSSETESISDEEQLTRADTKILKKDFEELDDDERTRLIAMQGDMSVEELEEYKEDLKRLYVQEMTEAYGPKGAGEKFKEDFDYEIRKRKRELTEEEKEADKKLEKEVSKSMEEATRKIGIEESITDIVGETNNLGNESISKIDINDNYGTEEDGDKLVIANINASENITNDATKKAILIDSTKIFENLFNISNVSEVALNWDFPLVDKKGNEKLGTIIKITMDIETAKEINWENFN